MLLERLEQRPHGGVEAVAEAGQVGGAADRDPLVGAVVDIASTSTSTTAAVDGVGRGSQAPRQAR